MNSSATVLADENFPVLGPRPWRIGNTFELLINGNQFFPRLLSLIETSRTCVDIEMYLFRSGRLATKLIDALLRARQRDVRVRLLLDHVGSRELARKDRQKLRLAGVEVRFYNRVKTHKLFRNLARDHRKIICIDAEVSLVGGAGITDDFDPAIKGKHAWREVMLEVRGPVVVDWETLFENTWSDFKGPKNFGHWRERIYRFRHATLNSVRLPTQAPQARANGSRGLGSEQIKKSLIKEIKEAEYYIWLSTAYFYPSWKLRRELAKAARRGVDVRILVPGPKTDHPSIRYAGQNYYSMLLNHQVRIYEYQPSFMHMKVANVDDWCTIGSCNFDRWNLRWNLEANQEILDPRFSEKIRRMFVDDFFESKLIDPNTWKKRPYFERVKQAFWYRVGLLIDRWINQ